MKRVGHWLLYDRIGELVFVLLIISAVVSGIVASDLYYGESGSGAEYNSGGGN